MDVKFNRSIGFILLAIYLILVGIIALLPAIEIPVIIVGIIALLAGIFILINR